MKNKFRSVETAKLAIEADLAWLNKLAMLAGLTFTACIYLKIVGEGTVTVSSVSISTDHFIFLLTFYSVIHYFVAIHLTNKLSTAWTQLPFEKREEFYSHLVATSGILTRGVYNYQHALFRHSNDDTVYVSLKTRTDDPPVWVHVYLATSALISAVPFEFSSRSFLILILSICLLRLNWAIGSNWLIALVNFAQPGNTNFLFTNGYGPRTVTVMSGFFLSERMSWHKFAARSFFGYLIGSCFYAALLYGAIFVLTRLI